MKRARDLYDDDYLSSDSEQSHRRKLPEEGTEDEDKDESPPPSQPPQRKHFCVICEKQFSSGKAYGGHVRIHSIEYNNKGKMKMKKKPKKMKRKIGLVKKEKEKEIDLIRVDVEGKIKCYLCETEFQTMHSLFGHMRRHPERSWKGIRPPSPQENDDVSDDDDSDDDVIYNDVISNYAISNYAISNDAISNDVLKAACILIKLNLASLKRMNKAMESPKSEVRCSSCSKDESEEDKIFDDGEKTDSQDMKIEMETEVKVNEPQGEAKRPLGFDINQTYYEDDDHPYSSCN